jgi:ribosomal protein S17E
MTMNEFVPFPSKETVFTKGNCFLPKQNFTIDNIINICEFRPYAMMGGEITSYQKEEVPKFIKHLSEIMSNIYNELCSKYDRAKIVVDTYSHIGRKAILNTINPNVGKLIDIHKGEWIWDGEYLTSFNSKASFLLVNKFSEMRIKPEEGCEIIITDNNQVNENTKFLS